MAGREEFREQVRDSNDIVEVVGEAVALRPAGPGRFAGLCPFHNETAPSFQVNAELGFFHCFGCKESGDVFGFLMKREGLSFPEALHQLARRAGIPIPETDPKKFSRNEQLRAANRKALDYYQRALRGEAGFPARSYLKKRGIAESAIAEYGLGFAPDRWDGLITTLKKSGIDLATLTEAGLAREGKGGNHLDFFRNRVIVPIFDSQGRAAGFAGRSLDGSEPKYINSPDSPIYRKRSVLYGLHRARSTIRRERTAILFEGYFDCLSAWQAGIGGAVAVCGTALTPDHAKLLAAQTRDIVLAFDADSGGRRATLASLPILLEAQLRVRVAPLSGGRDPDDIIREGGADAFREALRKAPAFVGFLVDEALQRARSGGDQAAAAREVLEIIARAPSPLDRSEWLNEAASSLGFSQDTALEELERLRRRPSRPRPQTGNDPPPGMIQQSRWFRKREHEDLPADPPGANSLRKCVAAEPEHEPGLDPEGSRDFALGKAEPHPSAHAVDQPAIDPDINASARRQGKRRYRKVLGEPEHVDVALTAGATGAQFHEPAYRLVESVRVETEPDAPGELRHNDIDGEAEVSEKEVMDRGIGAERSRGPPDATEDRHVIVHVHGHFATDSEADRGAVGKRNIVGATIDADTLPETELDTDIGGDLSVRERRGTQEQHRHGERPALRRQHASPFLILRRLRKGIPSGRPVAVRDPPSHGPPLRYTTAGAGLDAPTDRTSWLDTDTRKA
jgi:DNA primase